ncbi:ScpA family protein [Micromonospora sp. WMMA1363]|uniref:segregation and condensation protein A n=1 Tax=Micromonospora sp. WMMA1363 TaxID=3053985 RepID=UPI00259C70CB|nr:ScpA family protein [Micromonospora sp. WMMA1363]MDM4718615.1 ScpA family protein [Micromonospora sp. WMMA1363]
MTAPPLDQPVPHGVGAPVAAAELAAEAVGVVPADPETVAQSSGFTVRLANFTGPFDLLLQLISKHRLDVTEVALHKVTDEFIAYIRAMGDQWDLDETSEFLLVAATLLDLKAARLLPAAQVEDEDDLALLEARDLLFARLLQYKAYKEAAAHIGVLEETGGRRWPRAVALEPRYAQALPDLVLGIGPERLRALAVQAFAPKPIPEVSITHVHMARVSVREHAGIIAERLRRAGAATFAALCADCAATLEVVARFLALLELYREGLVAFVQEQALEELTVRWTGPTDGGPDLDIDEYAGAPSPALAADPGAAAPAGPESGPASAGVAVGPAAPAGATTSAAAVAGATAGSPTPASPASVGGVPARDGTGSTEERAE